MRCASAVTAVLALVACVPPPGSRESDDSFTVRGVASATSLTCSEREVARLGYTAFRSAGDAPGEGTVRGERRFTDQGPEPTRGYLTVSVTRDAQAGVWMYVRAERWEESTPFPVPTNVPPRGRPEPTPLPRSRQPGARRVSPGVVASHARAVVQACSFANGREVAAR